MSLKVYNTKSGKKEVLYVKEGRVKMYVCGITPYDDCHIGHARCYVVFDVIRKYLKYKGYDVLYVQNFTDIDDKIIEKAGKLQKRPAEIAEKYIKSYYEVMGKLGISKPDIEPRVTEHIAEVIKMIQGLLEKGYAYIVDKDVFYDVSRFSDYGKFSGRDITEMRPGARVEKDPRKHNPMDFALWKNSKQGEPGWDSPWGRGRPGWHIECSVMSMKYLGNTIDMHGGGQDLIFPHHENEIAQSEAFSGELFSRYWVHNGFVTMNKEKMSKSTGNIFTLKELFKQYSPAVTRLFLLSQHYRKPIDFSADKLEESKKMLDRFAALNRDINFMLNIEREKEDFKEEGSSLDTFSEHKKRFEEAMDDDFNTASAIGALNDIVTYINKYVQNIRSYSDDIRYALEEMKKEFNILSDVLGIRDMGFDVSLPPALISLIKKREEARKNKKYDLSDSIRDELRTCGVIVEDTAYGTRWKQEKITEKNEGRNGKT